MSKITKKESEEYVDNDGNSCPKCKSINITGYDFDSDCNYAWRECSCDDCGAKWRDLYTLTGIEGIE